jgi:hypothetical protein
MGQLTCVDRAPTTNAWSCDRLYILMLCFSTLHLTVPHFAEVRGRPFTEVSSPYLPAGVHDTFKRVLAANDAVR